MTTKSFITRCDLVVVVDRISLGRHTFVVENIPVTLFPILLASLVGSPHCAGMCGGFVAWYSHDAERHWSAHLLYNTGRLFTYLTLGIAAAWLGQSVNGFSSVASLSAIIVGSALISIGILKIFGLGTHFFDRFSSAFGRVIASGFKSLPKIPKVIRPLLVGIVTTLLPCGWLYSFVALAMASSDLFHAAYIMTAFWLGTLPMLSALGFFSRIITRRMARHLPRVTGVLLVLSGLYSFTLHLQHANHSSHHSHHDSN